MGSLLGAHLEAERREARWGDRPTTGPHERCVTRQVTIVTHMVFKMSVPIVPDSTRGAYPETKRREAKWGPARTTQISAYIGQDSMTRSLPISTDAIRKTNSCGTGNFGCMPMAVKSSAPYLDRQDAQSEGVRVSFPARATLSLNRIANRTAGPRGLSWHIVLVMCAGRIAKIM